MPELSLKVTEDTSKRVFRGLSELDPFKIILDVVPVDVVSGVGNCSQGILNVEQVNTNISSVNNLGSDTAGATGQ